MASTPIIPPERRVIVTGGREYADEAVVRGALARHLVAGDVLVHGAAAGADTLAARCAAAMGFGVLAYHADWKAHGASAGPRRNRAMLADGARVLLAFPGGRGTADMVRQAKRAGLRVVEVGGAAGAP
jgi:predicted Rossmann-fold nucleotide-binding protein